MDQGADLAAKDKTGEKLKRCLSNIRNKGGFFLMVNDTFLL